MILRILFLLFFFSIFLFFFCLYFGITPRIILSNIIAAESTASIFVQFTNTSSNLNFEVTRLTGAKCKQPKFLPTFRCLRLNFRFEFCCFVSTFFARCRRQIDIRCHRKRCNFQFTRDWMTYSLLLPFFFSILLLVHFHLILSICQRMSIADKHIFFIFPFVALVFSRWAFSREPPIVFECQ